VAVSMLAIGICGQPPSAPAPSPLAVSLSTASPATRVSLILDGAAAVELSVTKIANPSGQPIGIRVEVDVCKGASLRKYDLGLASPFPKDQIGVFVLPLPKDASTQLTSCKGAGSLVLSVVPLREGETLTEGILIAADIRAK
jgi:hypothetical protein